MAGYNQLKASIASVIKTNNAREITGQLLQNVLNQMVGVIGENLQLAGFADPTTNPGQPDQNIFYIAEQEGVYSHFNNTVLEGGLSFLMWKDGNWSSHTMQVVTDEYIKNHYVSIDFFRSIFRVYDEDGNEILPNNEPDPILGTQEVIDNIKAQVGLWTEYYLSALGRATGGGGGGGGATSLDELSNVTINTNTLANGQALVYNSVTQMWENQTIQAGTDMQTVWNALAGATSQQINISHLTDALATYATQAWVSQNFITVAYFDRLFRAYNGNTLVSHNDTTTTIDNIKAMFGFWTDMYLSALGRNSAATGLGIDNLTDVTINTPTDGQVLQYNAANSKWENATIQTVVALSGLTDVLLTSVSSNQVLIYDSNSAKWINSSIKTVNGYSLIGSGDIPASGGGTGNYLPLAGGTMTGDITFSGNRFLRNGNGYGALMITNSWTTLGPQNIEAGIDTYIDGTNIHIRSGLQTDTILCNSNKTVSINGSLRVTGTTGTWTQGIKVFPASDGVGFVYVGDTSNYNALALTCIPNSQIYRLDILRANNSASIQIPFANGTMALDGYCTGQYFYMDNGTSILYCNNSARLSILACGEAAATIQIRPLAMSSESNMTTFLSNGNVGISVASPSYKLHVSGDIYATGAITALSDMRDKQVNKNAELPIEWIANAPAFSYYWKDKKAHDELLHVGSSAQYWRTVLPEVVLEAKDEKGTLSMQYGVAALVSAITIARKVVDHERRITELEKENEELKKQLNAA